AVREQADGDLVLVEETFEPDVRTRLPAVPVDLGDRVESGTGRDDLDEHEPRGLAIRVGDEFADGVGGPERLAVLGERDFERVGNGISARRAQEVALLPAEHFAKQTRKISDRGDWLGAARDVDRGDPFKEALVGRDDVAVEKRLSVDEGRR